MSETGNGNNNCGDNKTQQADVNLEDKSPAPEVPPQVVENKPVTPVKRTPTKRLSAVERAQRESEELVKTLGGSLDIEGGRKTRSSTRGTPSRSTVVQTPPPAKRARGAATPKRGRGRKLETSIEEEIKTSPEKAPQDVESKEEIKENSTVEVAKPEEKNDNNKSESIPSKPDEKTSPVKEDDKPEPMEVDGINTASNNVNEEPSKADESQNKTNSSSEPATDELEKSEKVTEEKPIEDTKTAAEETTPQVSTETEKTAALLSDNVKSSSETTAHENNVEANDVKANTKPISGGGDCLPTDTPAKPVSVASNEHKTENNELCEPKIASPPIEASDGVTPQYCN